MQVAVLGASSLFLVAANLDTAIRDAHRSAQIGYLMRVSVNAQAASYYR